MIKYVSTKARQLYLLNQYMNGQLDLTNSLNVLMRVRNKNYYEDIGEYFIDKCFSINKNTNEIEFIKNAYKNTTKKDKYVSAAIFLMTSFINKKSLKKMFGEPIYHNEFGEGFDEDEQVGDYNCLSYFIEINDDIYHITYDNRGTSIEVPEKASPDKILEDIKELIDLYLDKN
jgi:hypothetical protein